MQMRCNVQHFAVTMQRKPPQQRVMDVKQRKGGFSQKRGEGQKRLPNSAQDKENVEVIYEGLLRCGRGGFMP